MLAIGSPLYKMRKFIMLEPESYAQLKQEIAERIVSDRALLDQLRAEIRPLRSEVRRIQPRTITSISLVATDGGNNSIQFDPFLIHLVRIVDSDNKEYCLEAITPTTKISSLSAAQFHIDGSPATKLGEMMSYLGVRDLTHLSPMIHTNENGKPTSLGWVKVYREMQEWAALFSLIRKPDFLNETVIIFDGLLRSVVFSGDLFKRYLGGLQEGIAFQRQQNHRNVYLAGIAKQSKVLSRYRLAMALEGILMTNYPAYLAIPIDMENKAYIWTEYARGDEHEREEKNMKKLAGGKMYFVKFGSKPRDPIWPVDIFLPQAHEAHKVLGYLLGDATNGFPVPLYPQSLQKAHKNAALVELDFDILQNHVFDGIRQILAGEASALDVFRLQDADPAQRRYE
jgi:nicotinamidase-related amidase